MTTLLAVETAGDACSAALWMNGEVRERYEVAPREHTRLILPMIDSLLAEAGLQRSGLDALAFGRGPGSFTGVRIAAGIAQGIACALDLPVVPVSTLAALAQGASEHVQRARILPALDARMGEVYWGMYEAGEDGLVNALAADVLHPPEAVAVPETGGWCGAGSGWGAYGDVLLGRLGDAVDQQLPGQYPRAAAVARLAARGLRNGEAVPAERALPVYLRDKVTS